MRLAGWSWNLLNLMALPLVLGTGVDYSIFMQLALKRHQGDVHQAYLSVGRALLLCGGTAIAGFGSLAWSSNAGMASLGQLCAVGVGSNMLIAIFLLPIWWYWVTRNGSLQSGSVAPLFFFFLATWPFSYQDYAGKPRDCSRLCIGKYVPAAGESSPRRRDAKPRPSPGERCGCCS
jgi:multidrug efflux pump subunit AcrB